MQNMKKKPNISILNRIDIFLIKEVVTERPLNNLHTIRYKWSFFSSPNLKNASWEMRKKIYQWYYPFQVPI